MTMECKYCGTNLPKDDARFCNNCGMLVPSHPLSPQSLSALKNDSKHSLSSSPPDQQPHTAEKEAPVEASPESSQAANEGPAPVEPLAVHKQESTPVRPRFAQISQQSPAWPSAVTHISMKEAHGEHAVVGQKLVPPTPVHPQADIIEEQVIADLPTSELAVPVEEPVIADLPTSELAVPAPVEELPTSELAVPAPVEELPTSELAVPAPVEELPTDEVATSIDELPTREVAAVGASQSRVQEPAVEIVPTNSLAEESERDIASSPYAHASTVAYTEVPSVFPPSSIPAPRPMRASAPPPPPLPAPVRSYRRQLIIVAALLVVLITGGVVAWVTISQPFSIAPITQPQVGFSDTQLGVSLLYPNGWIKQLTAGTAHFYAGNHIADITINVANNSATVSQSLQQQASTLGMSGTKAGATLSFAGATWQQLQGTVQQSGANYSDTILATTHGGHLFIITQQAPQNNYADWEKEFFAPLRTSLKFL